MNPGAFGEEIVVNRSGGIGRVGLNNIDGLGGSSNRSVWREFRCD